uniref:Uncharacterized protein n=1 Tax=Parascaris equorum TaxID=6256 RepID=A0A914S7A0_PAREQ
MNDAFKSHTNTERKKRASRNEEDLLRQRALTAP